MTAAELIELWERASSQGPVQRSLALAAPAWPRLPVRTLDALPLGRVTEGVLAVRERCFGGKLAGLAACPACGEQMEFETTVATLRGGAEGMIEGDFEAANNEGEVLEFEGGFVSFRVPSAADLAAVAGEGSVAQARQRLLDRCVLSAQFSGRSCPTAELPAPVVSAVVARMAEADPLASIQLELECSDCGKPFEAPFDAAEFLWVELQAAAHRLLQENHLLASAYGWSEADILGLSPARRHTYLQLIRGGA